MLDYVLTVYGYGYDVDAIAYDVEKDEEEVLGMLSHFREENTVSGRRYSDKLRSIIIERFKNGITPFIIEKELGLGKGIAKRMLIKAGFELPKSKGRKKATLDYVVIQHENFLKCPDCGSVQVNEIGVIPSEIESDESSDKKKKKKHSYCKNCGVEWYKVGSETRKILFHELSDTDIDEEE